jgi:RNA polymerase sigma-70 factor (ECF subfamily)
LFVRISEGSEAAFEELYRLFVPQLASYLQRISQSGTVVDEMIQETFLQVWLQRDKLPAVEHPKAWVFRIASNITFNYLKRVLVGEKAMAAMASRTAAAYNDVEDILYVHQLKKAIARAVGQLSPQRKKVYQLSRDAGLTIPEIADQLGLSASTVKNTLVSSLQFIRESLQQEGHQIGWFLIFLLIS